jgi:long-chain acyl-CoA synthetase
MVENPRILTIPAFLYDAVERRGDEPALGTIHGGELRWRTWGEIWHDAETLAATLRVAGVSGGDPVAQVSENRYEWIVVDLALHLSGAVHVPIHVALSAAQIVEQIAQCGARSIFVSRAEILSKFAHLLTHGERIFVHDEQDYGQEKPPLSATGQGPAGASPSLVSPDDLATILFTSGTTGRPRGVMLSQRNLASNAAAMADALGSGSEYTRLNVLPFSHIYARTCDLYTWVYRGSRLVLAESRETLVRDCHLAQPTVFNAVPYLYQRIADRVRASGAADEAAALATTFGGRMKQLCCGGAALAPDVEIWYAEHGLPILPGYGLTEASPVISVSTPGVRKAGTVGRPLAGVDVRIADDGEVLTRGPNVMLGYWQDDLATAAAIRDGWLHTGDLGELDADGFLTIRGRKKELIVLSTGKKVSPTRVESLLTGSPLVEQAVVFGEGRSALVALVVPVRSEGRGASREELGVEIANCLSNAAHEEQVRDFVVLERAFSIDRGELTPKLSLRRDVIARNFAAELATLGMGAAADERGANSAAK